MKKEIQTKIGVDAPALSIDVVIAGVKFHVFPQLCAANRKTAHKKNVIFFSIFVFKYILILQNYDKDLN